ncbi:hypothetical protein SDC9_175761 [bioreactor metagenome]|uniref:Uncharacterized protein n=1 Tax=bioreactor metagenome TaxID=1076179 RepID=A0A645GQ20_9ZZZZ
MLKHAVDECGALQRAAADAAADEAAGSKRQPGKVALRQREVFKQDEFDVGFLFGGLREQRREIGARGVLRLWRIVFHINTEYSTNGSARTTNKETTPEGCILKKPTHVIQCVYLSDNML